MAAKTSTTTTTTQTPQGEGGRARGDQRHYHHLHQAAMWAVPTLLLAILLLQSLEGLVKGLVRLAEVAPAGPARKLTSGLLLLFTRALGGGKGGELPLSFTAVLLTAVLISILVLAIGSVFRSVL